MLVTGLAEAVARYESTACAPAARSLAQQATPQIMRISHPHRARQANERGPFKLSRSRVWSERLSVWTRIGWALTAQATPRVRSARSQGLGSARPAVTPLQHPTAGSFQAKSSERRGRESDGQGRDPRRTQAPNCCDAPLESAAEDWPEDGACTTE